MSTVVSENKYVTQVKERLLAKHSLEAVFSMPKDLFHPLGVNTCILVFKAHAPHPQNKKTFFGYFKDDGFIKQKNSGRVDKNNKWKVIKESWLEHYTNKESVAGLSIVKNIKAKNEWCVEAYLETNYKDLTNEDFVNSIKSYLSFEFLSNKLKIINDSSFNQDKKYDLYHNQWGSFCYDKQHNGIFELPTTDKGLPDWDFMENYIKSLPYSSSL
jgi:type I restriction-modification system DNA methylase subunit